MSKEKQKVIKDLKFLIDNNNFDRSGVETSKINRVLGGVLSTPGDDFIEPLSGLFGTDLYNAGANLEKNILGKLRVIPGDNVHHIVPLGLLRDALKDHPLHVQADVLKLIEDAFGVQTGNTKRNLESILEFTHVFAGDKAAHPDGDTIQRYLRPTVLPVGSSPKEIFNSINQSLSTAIGQYRDAVAPGTVEAARRQNVVDRFSDAFGIHTNPFQLESDELQGALKALRISRAEAPDLDTPSFTKSIQNEFLQNLAIDPLGSQYTNVSADQYNRFTDFQLRRAIQEETGFKRGFSDLQPAAAPFGGTRDESIGFKNRMNAWLSNQGLEATRLNNQLAKKALQSQFNAELLKRNAGAVTPELLTAPADLMIKNKAGTLLGVTDREVGKLLGQGKVGQAALKSAVNGIGGAAAQHALKIVAKRLPAAATRFAAGSAGTGGTLMPAMAAYAAYDLADGVVEGATGKGITQRVAPHVQSGVKAAVKAAPALINKAQAVDKYLNPVGHRIDNEVQHFITNPIKSAFSKVFGNRGT